MTIESDVSDGAPGRKPPQARNKPSGPADPPAIKINMPKQGAPRQATGQPRAKSASMDNIEGLLGKLMSRLDESDHRYTNALNELNQRLNDLSERALSARGTHPDNAIATLDRVHSQASTLAAQVSEAGTAYRSQNGAPLGNLEQRMGEFTGANDDGPNPNFGDDRLNEDFADVTQRLERSLAARAPASEFDTLSHRMDDLAQRFDSALTTRNDLAALQTIESQLNALTAGFSDARQNYARVEAIEGHLVSLMNWAQSSGSPGNGDGNKRLDAIEKELHALNENAREMDARTVGTLQAMNEALHSLAANIGSPGGAHDHGDDATTEDGYEEPAQTTAAQPSPEELAEVWIDEQPGLVNAPRAPSRQAAPAPDQLGATIPDYQPAPGKQRSAGKTAHRARPQGRVEPTFEAENDFIASARRAAAAAAAQESAPRPAKSSRRSTKPMAGMAYGAHPSNGKRTRPILVIAAVGLMLISAGLLYSRLKSPSYAPVTGALQHSTPQAPALVPNQAPGSGANPFKPAPRAQIEKKQHSERMMNTPATPAQAVHPAPLATPPQAPVTRTSQHVPAPAPRPASAVIPVGQDISTATLLASLPPNAGQQKMPGVSVEIMDPAARAPAPRSSTGARTAAPALVPPAQSSPRQALIPLPKRAPAPGAASKPTSVNPYPVDSARANEVTPAAGKRQTRMPPARIGPFSLRNAAARGVPAAQVEIASRYAKGTGVSKNLKKAAEWYKRAAAQGFAPGQYRLAALYERGQGVKKDIGVARTWYRRSAELGNVRAMHNLAVLYTRSDGRRADYSSAKNWFLEAARHGLADSQFNLGILYESGLGVKKNTAEAYKWFTLAARQGDKEANKRGRALRPQLPARSLSAAEKIIKRWRPAPVKEAANRSGRPRGGWQNAKVKTSLKAGDPAIIARTQFLLNKLGYDAGVPDGKLGPQTTAAIRRFESRVGIARTGKATSTLLKRLEALHS